MFEDYKLGDRYGIRHVEFKKTLKNLHVNVKWEFREKKFTDINLSDMKDEW